MCRVHTRFFCWEGGGAELFGIANILPGGSALRLNLVGLAGFVYHRPFDTLCNAIMTSQFAGGGESQAHPYVYISTLSTFTGLCI